MSVLDGRGSGTGLLVRLGFQDTAATQDALEQLGLWSDGRPGDDGAAEVVTAVADVADPDLAVQALARLHAAQADPAALVQALCGHAGLRALGLLGLLGTSAALGDHLVARPDDWRVLLDDDLVLVRPSRLGLQTRMLAAVGAPAEQELRGGPAARGPP